MPPRARTVIEQALAEEARLTRTIIKAMDQLPPEAQLRLARYLANTYPRVTVVSPAVQADPFDGPAPLEGTEDQDGTQ